MSILEDILKVVFLGIEIKCLDNIEKRENPLCICNSCKEEYRFKESGSKAFCSDECYERGALLRCDYCREKYFRNEGYDDKFCKWRCNDDYESENDD